MQLPHAGPRSGGGALLTPHPLPFDRVLLAPVAMADKLPVEHGHTIGTGAPDPLATGAVHCVSEYTFI